MVRKHSHTTVRGAQVSLAHQQDALGYAEQLRDAAQGSHRCYVLDAPHGSCVHGRPRACCGRDIQLLLH